MGILFILFTPIGVFAHKDVAPMKFPKSLQIDPKGKPIQIGLQKDNFPKFSNKTTAATLLQQLRKSPGKSIKSGGVDSGGGTIVKTSQGIGLLDLYLYNKVAFADRRTTNNILESRSLQNLGVDLLTDRKQPIMQKTFAQIAKWSTSSPILTRYLKLALENLRVYYHQGTFITGPLEYYLPDQSAIKTSGLKMIAIYVKGFGVHIGLDDFRNLPETHQIALLIHEGLRAMSIAGDFKYSNEIIQKITATLVSNPRPGDSLDQDIFLNGEVLFSRLEFADLIQNVQILKREICSGDYDVQYEACEVQEKDAAIGGARQIAENIFVKLFSLPKSKKTAKLLSQAFEAVTRFEDSSLRDILSEAHLITLPQGYLTMLLDSCIDIENKGGLRNQDTIVVKKALRLYFQSIGVDIRYRN